MVVVADISKVGKGLTPRKQRRHLGVVKDPGQGEPRVFAQKLGRIYWRSREGDLGIAEMSLAGHRGRKNVKKAGHKEVRAIIANHSAGRRNRPIRRAVPQAKRHGGAFALPAPGNVRLGVLAYSPVTL